MTRILARIAARTAAHTAAPQLSATLALLAAIFVTGATASTAGAQDDPPDAGPPRDLAPVHNMEALAKAQALVAEMIEAYRPRATMTDWAKYEAFAAGKLVSMVDTDIRMGKGVDAWMKTTRTLLVALDGTMYLEYSDLEDRYLTRPIVGDVMSTLVQTFGQYGGAMGSAALRYGKGFEEIMSVLIKGLPRTARLSGYRDIVGIDGRKMHQITLVSAVGSAEINVDAETKFLVNTRCEWVSEDAPVPNFRQVIEMTYKPEVHETLPIPITWERKERMEFQNWRAMRGAAMTETLHKMSVKVGDILPDFQLRELTGAEFELGARGSEGKLVLLLFWAYWDAPSRIALHELVKVRDWAASRGIDLEVMPVHTLAQLDNESELWDKTMEFLDHHAQQFTLPSLLDPTDTVAGLYGITGVPIGMLVDRMGRLHHVDFGLHEARMMGFKPHIEAAWQGLPPQTVVQPEAGTAVGAGAEAGAGDAAGTGGRLTDSASLRATRGASRGGHQGDDE